MKLKRVSSENKGKQGKGKITWTKKLKLSRKKCVKTLKISTRRFEPSSRAHYGSCQNSLWIGQSCYLTNVSLNFLIVVLVSDDIRENSRLDLNKFICDELQPNEEFHRLFNDAVDSLYRELQTDLQGTEYAIHNLIKVGGQTAPLPSPEKWVVEKDAGEKVSL